MAAQEGSRFRRLLEGLIRRDNARVDWPTCASVFGWTRVFPFTDAETAQFLTKLTDTSVMGILALNTFCATYMLYWAKPGSACMPIIPVDSEVVSPRSWQQLIFGVLPFVIFPLTLLLSGLARGAENNRNALSCLATLCLCEVLYVVILGGGMAVCFSGCSVTAVGIITLALVVLLTVVWGSMLSYPRFLRKLIWSKCFRQQELLPDRGVPLLG